MSTIAAIPSPLFKESNPEAHPFPKASKISTKFIPPPPEQLTEDGRPIGDAPSAELKVGHRPQWINTGLPLDRIVEMISRSLYRDSPDDQFEAVGREALKAVIAPYVETGETIEVVFPGFHFKGPGKDRVLGSLPDFAEEMLLRRLEMLALTIGDYHPAGAVIRIVSDGVVYGELLQQPDTTLHQYDAELRRMASEFGLTHLSFIRAGDLLHPSSGLSDDPITEEEYIKSNSSVRVQFTTHDASTLDVDDALKTDTSALNTYRGHLKFLADIFADSKEEKELRSIAKSLLKNGAIFSDLVSNKFPRAVRISGHAHNNAGPKYAFNTFPGAARAISSWDTVVMQKANGSLVVDQLHTFNSSKYEIVHRNGRPYYIREPTEDLNLGDKINPHVTITPHVPFGLVIKADPTAGLSFNDLPMQKVRTLGITHSLVLLQGFASINEEDFVSKSKTMGEVAYWPYGPILKLKETPGLDLGNTLTTEAMPMHYDGVFKEKTLPNGEVTNDPPLFQMFQCISAPGGTEGGKTMITNGADVFRDGLTQEQRDWLSARTTTVFTPANMAFGGSKIERDMVIRDEYTGRDALRWLELWPRYVTKFTPQISVINGVSPAVSEEVGEYLTDLVYDRRFCYSHSWTSGDILLSENYTSLHNRTAFKPCSRELWRIHVN